MEIHVKNKAVEAFCYGVMVSSQHVLTTSECEWVHKQFLGRQPEAKFPYLPNQPSINFKSNWQSNWAGSQDQYALALYELERPLTSSSNFTPICLPNLAKSEEDFQSESQLNPSAAADEENCTQSEARIPGFPAIEEIDGRFFLEGLRANTCPSLDEVLYLSILSSRRWLEAALMEDSKATHPFNDLVNGLCPHVTRWEIEKSCYKAGSLPGRISGLSKVKCGSWRLFQTSSNSVQVQCDEAEESNDGEIVTLALSQISCRVVDCHLPGEAAAAVEAEWIPLSGLGDCMKTEEEVRGCGSTSDSFTTSTEEEQEEDETTLSPFFGTRSAIVFNDASASSYSSTLQSSKAFHSCKLISLSALRNVY